LATAGIERPNLLAAVAAWYGELAARVGEDAGAARAFESIASEGVSPEDCR
ncbi:MAG: hypothetical protein QOE61_3391, partial [Micromonosporaceae bacterium]|nr:hypothetical protein [Micromonosporaceae bacterium]